MTPPNLSFLKNKALLEFDDTIPHAFATYRIDNLQYTQSIIEDIAIGQSLGAWETSYVSENILREKVAKVTQYEEHENYFDVTIAFPYNLWHGKISWLVTLIFGKMSFYPGIQLNNIEFSQSCFEQNLKLRGPRNDIHDIRNKLNLTQQLPLLMGILKPNVAMNADQVCDLYCEAAHAGIDLLKDDEIRFDRSKKDVLERVSLIANIKQKNNLKTLYAVNLQISGADYLSFVKDLEEAGADAFLINTWTYGLDILQSIRTVTSLPLFSHPALVGAFGLEEKSSTLHPRVTLAQLLRAAGADFSLFPSPYGKLGLPKSIALDVAKACTTQEKTTLKGTIPVPSAGIKPEHAQLAKADFGNDFVLNAGTSIFASGKSIAKNIEEFKIQLEK